MLLALHLLVNLAGYSTSSSVQSTAPSFMLGELFSKNRLANLNA